MHLQHSVAEGQGVASNEVRPTPAEIVHSSPPRSRAVFLEHPASLPSAAAPSVPFVQVCVCVCVFVCVRARNRDASHDSGGRVHKHDSELYEALTCMHASAALGR
jgi:hypothetical protein